jgi:Icc-related predicted phosphoesterase
MPEYDQILFVASDAHQEYRGLEEVMHLYDVEKAKYADQDDKPYVGSLFLGDISNKTFEGTWAWDILFEPENFVQNVKAVLKGDVTKLKNIFGNRDVNAIPGNYDSKELGDILGTNYSHNQVKDVGGLNAAFYGGADIYAIQVQVARLFGLVYEPNFEEAKRLLETSSNLDIFATHDVPDGMGYKVSEITKWHELFRKTIEQKLPGLAVHGHFHQPNIGLITDGSKYSIIVNPGPIGQDAKVDIMKNDLVNQKKNGYFAKVYMKNKKVMKVEQYAIDFDEKNPILFATYDFSNLNLAQLQPNTFYYGKDLADIIKPQTLSDMNTPQGGHLPEEVTDEQKMQLKELFESQINDGIKNGKINSTNYESQLVSARDSLVKLNDAGIDLGINLDELFKPLNKE